MLSRHCFRKLSISKAGKTLVKRSYWQSEPAWAAEDGETSKTQERRPLAGQRPPRRPPLTDAIPRAQRNHYTERNPLLRGNAKDRQGPSRWKMTFHELLQRLETHLTDFGSIWEMDIKHATLLLKTGDKPLTSEDAHILIRSCGNALIQCPPQRRMEYLKEIMDTLKEKEIKFDTVLYNLLMLVYIDNEHSFSPTEMLKTMTENDVFPNRVTYQRMVQQYCAQGDMDGALRIVEYMREGDIPVTESLINTLMFGFMKIGEEAKGKEALQAMQQSTGQTQTSVNSLVAMMRAYGEIGQWEKVEELLRRASNDELFFSDSELHSIIICLAKGGLTDNIDQVLGMCPKFGGYFRETMATCCRLVYAGLTEAAYKVLMGVKDGGVSDPGKFFARLLVVADRPVPELLQYCRQMREDGLWNEGVLTAVMNLFTSQTYSDVGKKTALMVEFAREYTGRPHLFWPLIADAVTNGDKQSVVDVLKAMREFTPWDFDTFFTALFHRTEEVLGIQEAVDLAVELEEPVMTVLTPYIRVQLNSRNVEGLERALRLLPENELLNLRCYAYLRDGFTNALAEYPSEDLPAVFNLVSAMLQNRPKRFDRRSVDVAGDLAVGLVIGKRALASRMQAYFNFLLEQGATIPEGVANAVIRAMENLPEAVELRSLVDRVTRQDRSLKDSELRDTPEALEERLALSSPNREGALLFNLLVAYDRQNNFEKTVETFEKLSEKGPLNPGPLAIMTKVYAKHGDLDQALSLYRRLLEVGQGVSDPIIRDLLVELVKGGRMEDAQQVLRERKPVMRLDRPEYPINMDGLLKALMETVTDVEEIRAFIKLLVEVGFCRPTSYLFGPLVQFHMKKGDTEAAFSEFETITAEYRKMAHLEEFFEYLLEKDDRDMLQKVFELGKAQIGANATALELTIALLRRNDLTKAAKLLHGGLRPTVDSVRSVCDRAKRDRDSKLLERWLQILPKQPGGLLTAQSIFKILIEIYGSKNDLKGVKEALLTMEELTIPPHNFIKTVVDKLFRRMGEESPFPDHQPPPQQDDLQTRKHQESSNQEFPARERP